MLFGKVVTIISVYGSKSGRRRIDSFDDLSAEVQSKNVNCIVQGDVNGHIGSSINGYERVHGGQRWGNLKSKDDVQPLEFVGSFDGVVGYTFLKKDSEKIKNF